MLLESEKNIQIKNEEKLSLNKNLENENSKLNFYEKENEQGYSCNGRNGRYGIIYV